jgi:endonuclease/exonuclease/phosphatase family metal-dependent hydrolase
MFASCSLLTNPRVKPSATAICRSAPPGAPTLGWSIPPGAADRQRLDAWCAGVGPPLFQSTQSTSAGAQRRLASDVAFVSWNVHVGAGDVERLVTDLREGRLGPPPVEEFVLMLQEAVRFENVPASLVPGARTARWIGVEKTQAFDIGEVARRLHVSFFYVPSMRNGGASRDDRAASDRGNAILSTLPLADPLAIELPGRRQRRVSVRAVVPLNLNGLEVRLAIGSTHFNVLGSARTMWIFGAASARAQQAEEVIRSLGTGPAIVGGDVNSWEGRDERAVRALLEAFPETPAQPETTFRNGLVLDWMFFRLPHGSSGRVIRARERYGADHYPIIGWISTVPTE